MQLREYGVMIWLTPEKRHDVCEVVEAINEFDAIYRVMGKYGIHDARDVVSWLYSSLGLGRNVWVHHLCVPLFD